MDPRLETMVDKIQDKALCRKVSDLLDGLSIEIEGVRHDGLPLAEAPAGISRHHNYPGGLLEHTLSSANIALAMCDCVEKIYGGKIDRDYVISGILLHDICKCLTYRVREDGTYTSSPLGERANHMLLITSELVRRDFPLDLIHIVAAHHGRHGLVSPRTVEALIVYLADVLDAQFNGEIIRLARGLIREAACPAPDKMDSEMALKIIHSKVTDGWEGLRTMMEKAKQNCVSESRRTKETGKFQRSI